MNLLFKLSGSKIVQGFVHKHCFPVIYPFIESHPAQPLKKFSRRSFCVSSKIDLAARF